MLSLYILVVMFVLTIVCSNPSSSYISTMVDFTIPTEQLIQDQPISTNQIIPNINIFSPILSLTSHLCPAKRRVPTCAGDYDPLPPPFSAELKSLVARLLAVDPQQRLGLAEALKEEAHSRRCAAVGRCGASVVTLGVRKVTMMVG